MRVKAGPRVMVGAMTRLVEPLKASAPPKRPAVVQVAPETVAVLPLPEASGAVVPAPWLKEYAARGPGAEPLATEKVMGKSVVLALAALSWQRTEKEEVPPSDSPGAEVEWA